MPVAIDEEMLEAARADMAELPAERAERFERELGLSAESAQLLAFRAELGDYFEAALAAGAEPAPPAQALANWIAGELHRALGEGEGASEDPAASRVAPRRSRCSSAWWPPSASASARRARCSTGSWPRAGDPLAIVEAEGLAAMDGGEELAGIVAAALAANADAAERVREGNAKAIGPIVGHVMRETKGRADGTEVARLVHEQLGT